MEYLQTSGKTILKVNNTGYGSYVVSVLSQRAACLALKLSAENKWQKTICALYPSIALYDFLIVGFQPETGYHIAYKIKALTEKWQIKITEEVGKINERHRHDVQTHGV